MLEPPNPGPYAGVPLGGIGTGCIGRGMFVVDSLFLSVSRLIYLITITRISRRNEAVVDSCRQIYP